MKHQAVVVVFTFIMKIEHIHSLTLYLKKNLYSAIGNIKSLHRGMNSFRIHLHTLPRPPHVLSHGVCGFIAVSDRVKVLVAGVFWVKSFCAFTRLLALHAGRVLGVWHERFRFVRVSVLPARHRGNKSLRSLRRLSPLRVAVRGAEGLLFAPSAPHFAGKLRQHTALTPVQVVVHQQELVDVCQATAVTAVEIGDLGGEAGAWNKQGDWSETKCCPETKWRGNIVLGFILWRIYSVTFSTAYKSVSFGGFLDGSQWAPGCRPFPTCAFESVWGKRFIIRTWLAG